MPENTGKTKPLPVRIDAELVKRIDDLRGLVPREPYIRHLLTHAVEIEERRARKGVKK
jgi:hypothetical protein